MNNSNICLAGNYQNFCYTKNEKETLSAPEFPTELKNYILFLLSPKDLQSTALVCKSFTVLSIDNAKKLEILHLKELALFIRIIMKCNEKDAPCPQGVNDLDRCTTLVDIRTTNEKIKEEILHILKYMYIKDLQLLKRESSHLNKSIFFRNMYSLATLYQEIDRVEKLESQQDKDAIFSTICKHLISKNEDDLLKIAKELANKIEDKSMRDKALGIHIEEIPLKKTKSYRKKALKTGCVIC